MKKGKAFTALLLAAVFVFLTACGASKAAPAPEPDKSGRYVLSADGEALTLDEGVTVERPAEDNARVFYEIFVGSFSDSDGDGTGDLRGVIDRMDYLNDGDPNSGKSLGIEGIWLTPIFLSPSYHKYDVTDYYTVDPKFGTTEDLQELAELCRERNVKLILDLPINHTGSRCQWFKDFCEARRKGDWESPYYDFYSCAGASSIPAGRTFRQINGSRFYYECNFSDDMPELNFDNPAVRQEVLNIARYYLDLGVSGFRFDAAKYVYLGDNGGSAEFWDWYMDQLRAYAPDIYTVAEVWDADSVIGCYEPSMNCFNFSVSQSGGLIAAAAKNGNVSGYVSYVEKYVRTLRESRADALYVPFITNHDQDRAAGFLTVSSGAMQMGANLYILGPGSPFLYYGEELGMKGSRGGANTDANRRLAMVWGDGDTVQDPAGSTYKTENQVKATAADQLGDGDSLLSYYKRLIRLRQANPEIARGEYRALSLQGSKAGGFVSTWEGSSVCVLHNTTDKEITVDLAKATELTFSQITAIGLNDASLDGTVVTLGAQTSAVLR